MDFQTLAERMPAMTCVVAVEKLPDGKKGHFKLVAGNKAYIDSIEHPAPGMKMLHDKFIPGSEYTEYITRDLNFEEYSYNAAINKKCLHSYAKPDRMDVWLNMIFLPIDAEDDEYAYCFYTMEVNFEPDSEALANTSAETAVSVLDTCIKLRGTNDFKATIQDVVLGISKLCDSEHCCILVMNEYERSCYVLAEDIKEGSGLLPMQNYVDDAFYDIAESWLGTIAGSNCLIAKNDDDMQVIKERNPVWYDSLTGAGAYNIVLFPLKSRSHLLGYMWALNFDSERAVRIKETLEVTTFILGSELGNYMLLDRLRMLSSKDMLTGVMNRNEMNNVVDKLSHGEKAEVSAGVIFADLNGLKVVNDIEGHSAGDLLLKNAANVLRQFFDEKSIFRAGGDEFSIILTDVTQEDIDKHIENIRKESEKTAKLSFALGGAVEKNSSNVRLALRRADERMYEDKKLFYESLPEDVEQENSERLGNLTKEDVNRERDIFREMNYDFMTGLPSMSYFFKLAETGRRAMHESDIPSALLYINLNGLKFFNKRYGFSEGDALIKELARLIAEQFGEENSSRFGQDHFAVFAEEKDLEKKLKKLFSAMKTANSGKTLPVRVGIYQDSMGIVETSLACDRAKYACNISRDDYNSYFNYFDQKMLRREINRQYIIDNLDRAIAENWIKPFYQPIVRATNNLVCDEEALARWIDPEKGMLSPADFIPILEDTKLIYKVDLYILDSILERINKQKAEGKLHLVPMSVNLSRTDFETCDIVEEICNRVDAAGVSRDLITIEITESVVGENFDFMKAQVKRFQDLGFPVWMDDFGSGYSSLDLLQEIQFDLIKFDMRFMRQFETTPKSRVILTELMRMAVSLGIETVCEGVETKEQVEFLREIGCTKLQGYHFCKPIPYEDVLERYRKGIQIGFENPDEYDYNRTLSSINLYDIGAVTNDKNESARRYYNTQPAAILECIGEETHAVRLNKSFSEFYKHYQNIDETFRSRVRQCKNVGQRIVVSEIVETGETVNAIIRKVADNPVNGAEAYAVAVLDITSETEQTLTYTGVARALSADYIDLYHIDLDTEKFTQYSPDKDSLDMSATRSGEHFFENAHNDAMQFLYEDDRKSFVEAFTKEKVIKALDETGAFTHTYRVMIAPREMDDFTQSYKQRSEGSPMYVSMKVVRLNRDGNHVVMAVNNVDAQMKQQELIDRLREETATYTRISALMGNFIGIYTVDPETGGYMQYSASDEFAGLGTSKVGLDFFEDSRNEIEGVIAPEDYYYFMAEFTKENVLAKTKKGGIYTIGYHLMIAGQKTEINLRAGIVQEKDGPQLIVGIISGEG